MAGEQANGGRDFWSSTTRQPVQAPHEFLVGFNELRFFVRWYTVFLEAINYHARAEWGPDGVTVRHAVGFEEGLNVSGLCNRNREGLPRLLIPFVPATEVPGHRSHEIDKEARTKFPFEVPFHFV